MLILKVGTILKQFIGAESGIMLDLDSYSATLIFSISPSYLQQYKLGGHYDFWCKKIDNVIFFAVKLRNNPWASAPFSPYLMRSDLPITFANGKGLPLFILLVDNNNGTIVDCDFITLGNDFSNGLLNMSRSILDKPFNPKKHRITVHNVYQQYKTDGELVELEGFRYSID